MQGHMRNKPADESERLFRVLGDFGDYDLVLAGVHENVVAQVQYLACSSTGYIIFQAHCISLSHFSQESQPHCTVQGA